MKIVSTGKTLSSFEYHEKRVKARRKKVALISSLVVVVLTLLVFFLRLESLQVREVQVFGAEVTGEEVVRSKVLESISGYLLWVIPHSNSLIYRGGQIERELASRFPRFSSVSVSLENFQVLDVEVIEREPFALYCRPFVQELDGVPCYFLDETGFIFDFSPAFSEGVYVIYSSTLSVDEPLGTAYLPPDEFRKLSRFVESLKGLKLSPLSLEMNEETFVVKLPRGAKISWSRQDTLDHVLSNLESFLNSPAIKAQSDFLEKFSELDFRTDDKVFYKFRE